MNFPELMNHLQAEYGVLGVVGLGFAGILLLVIAIRVTVLIVKLICWILVAVALILAILWIYSYYRPASSPGNSASISLTLAAPVSPKQ